MSQPLVSIVVNNFNYARFLAQSVESALGQAYPRIEVVVVDDGSTDDSRETIRRYASRTVALLRETNAGQAAAVNAGFEASHGEIVLFLDADDYLFPEAVSRVVSEWVEGLSKVQFRLDLVDSAGRKIDVFPPPEVRFDSGNVVPLLLERGRYETAVMSGNAFGRKILERILPVPEGDFRISADGYLVTVAPFHGPVASIDDSLGAYRQHARNAWSLGASSPGASALAARLRRTLQHDAVKYRALEAVAQKRGFRASPSPGLRDPQHLAARLGSRSLEPAGHPYPGDSRAGLAVRGALASRTARLPWMRRALLAGWFLAAGVLPRRVAAHLIAWLAAPGSRPAAIDRLFKMGRRLLRPKEARGAPPGARDHPRARGKPR